MSAEELLRELADALDREPYRHLTGGLAVDLEFEGQISQDQAERVARITRRLGHLETRGKVSASFDRHMNLTGFYISQKEGEDR